MKQRCPVCQKVIDAAALRQGQKQKFAPFCSQRCKLIDLGRWLDSDYRINTELKGGDFENTGEKPRQPKEPTPPRKN